MGDRRAAPHTQHPFYVEKGVKPSGQLSKVVRLQPEFLRSGEMGSPSFGIPGPAALWPLPCPFKAIMVPIQAAGRLA